MIKLIKQHDERDCGAACLAMVARHYGLHVSLSQCRILTKTDQEGTNLYALLDAGRQLHFNGEALEGNFSELMSELQAGTLVLPMIARIISEDGFEHFVVLHAIDFHKEKLTVLDPAVGKRRLSFLYFRELYAGHVVTLTPHTDFQKGNLNRGSLLKFVRLLHGQRRLLTGVIALTIVIVLLGILGTFAFQIAVDDFILGNEALEPGTVCDDTYADDHNHNQGIEIIPEEGDSPVELWIAGKVVALTTTLGKAFADIGKLMLALLSLYVISALMQWLRSWSVVRLSLRVDLPLVMGFYGHVIDLPLNAFASRKAGEIMARFSDTDRVREAISNATLVLILDTAMAITGGAVMLGISKPLFNIAVCIFALYALNALIFRKPLRTVNDAVMEQNARVTSYIKETIDGIETIKSAGGESHVKERTTEKYGKLLEKLKTNSMLDITQSTISELLEASGTVALLWVGVLLALESQVTLGELITFNAILSFFLTPLKNLVGLQPMMQEAIVAAERLNDLLDIETESAIKTCTNDSLRGDIQFEHVDFRYGNRPLTLKNVSIRIPAGAHVALIGESGSGKTTIAKLLMGFYEPEVGEISIGGRTLSDIGIRGLRSRIAYVQQDTFFFSDTVWSNLTFGLDSAAVSEAEVETVCKACGIHDFIMQMPNGYFSMLDENGNNLSGGQKQRLSIARALLKKPDIMVLDEATSNLDTITEANIRRTIDNMENGITCIIIAHRLSTIRSCEGIVVMDKGRVVEYGTHDDLIRCNSLYYRFWTEYAGN